ncbi:hypothetical protein D3C84_1248930 [compost metagenome]
MPERPPDKPVHARVDIADEAQVPQQRRNQNDCARRNGEDCDDARRQTAERH